MKKYLTPLFFLAIITTSAAQTIRIADNNANAPTGADVYSTLQAAINAASSGDIIYIQPSTTIYDDVTVGKALTILGVGYGSGVSGGKTSSTGTITITVGNIILKGFTSNYISINGPGTIDKIEMAYLIANYLTASTPLSNITVHNCHFGSPVNFENVTNIKIYNNSFTNSYVYGILQIRTSVNALVTNNIFFTDYNAINFNSPSTLYPSNINAFVLNNIFSGSGQTFAYSQEITVNNNIFFGKEPSGAGDSGFHDNSFNYNLSATNSLFPPTGAGGTNNGFGNIINQNPLFVNASIVSTERNDFDYSLAAGSPAKNAGSDGTDIGPTGGAYPISKNIVVYVPTSIPIITDFNTTGVIPVNFNLKANVKAKSN